MCVLVAGWAVLSSCGGGSALVPDAVLAPSAPEIEITPPSNRAPRAGVPIPAQTLTTGASTMRMDVAPYFCDPDGDRLTYSATSSSPDIVRAGVSGSVLSLTPVSAGTATVTVTAADGDAQAVQTVAATVHEPAPVSEPANRAPRAEESIPAQTLTTGASTMRMDVAPYFRDPDGDRLTYSATSSRPGIVRAGVSGSTLSLTPVSAGTATVTVTAADGEAQAVQTVAATVSAPEMEITPPSNRAPRAEGSIPAQTLTAGASTMRMDVAQYFRDPDGDRLTYSATSSGPGIVRAGMSGSTLSLTPVSAGTATVTVTAADGEAQAAQTVATTVSAPEMEITPPSNRAPRAEGSIPAQTLTAGASTMRMDVAPYFRDPDGDRLTYTATSSGPGIVRAGVSGSMLSLTPVSAGTATVTVTAADGDAQATQTVAATVQEPENPSTGNTGELTGFQFSSQLARGRKTTLRLNLEPADAAWSTIAVKFDPPDAGQVCCYSRFGGLVYITFRCSSTYAGSTTITMSISPPRGPTVDESVAFTCE